MEKQVPWENGVWSLIALYIIQYFLGELKISRYLIKLKKKELSTHPTI